MNTSPYIIGRTMPILHTKKLRLREIKKSKIPGQWEGLDLGLDPRLADHPLCTIQHHRWKEGHTFTLTPAKGPESGINVQRIDGWPVSICLQLFMWRLVYPNRQ